MVVAMSGVPPDLR